MNLARPRPKHCEAASRYPTWCQVPPAAPDLGGAWGAQELAVDQHVLGAGGLREAEALHQLVDASSATFPRHPARAGLRL